MAPPAVIPLNVPCFEVLEGVISHGITLADLQKLENWLGGIYFHFKISTQSVQVGIPIQQKSCRKRESKYSNHGTKTWILQGGVTIYLFLSVEYFGRISITFNQHRFAKQSYSLPKMWLVMPQTIVHTGRTILTQLNKQNSSYPIGPMYDRMFTYSFHHYKSNQITPKCKETPPSRTRGKWRFMLRIPWWWRLHLAPKGKVYTNI